MTEQTIDALVKEAREAKKRLGSFEYYSGERSKWIDVCDVLDRLCAALSAPAEEVTDSVLHPGLSMRERAIVIGGRFPEGSIERETIAELVATIDLSAPAEAAAPSAQTTETKAGELPADVKTLLLECADKFTVFACNFRDDVPEKALCEALAGQCVEAVDRAPASPAPTREALLDERNALVNSYGHGSVADGRVRDRIAEIDATVTAPIPSPDTAALRERAETVLPLVYAIVHEAWHALDDSEEWSPTEFLITAEHFKEMSDLFDKLRDFLDGTDDTTLGWEKPLNDMLRDLAAALPSTGTGEEVGWVIERASSDVSAPTYWCANLHGSSWTPKHLEAVRFARHRDAEIVRDTLMSGTMHRICQHIWRDVGDTAPAHSRAAALSSPAKG